MCDKLVKKIIEDFKELCKIPHPSDQFLKDVPYEKGRCWKMSCYLRDKFQKITGSNIFQDKYGNLAFDVPANDKSLESAPIITMQAHMDMVFAFDRSKFGRDVEPDVTIIEPVIETINGREIMHTVDYKTSLGADNGVGVAQILAILQTPEVKHGKLRVIITNCEENALQGAGLIAQETFKDVSKDCKYTLNLDGEVPGEMVVASSGGVGTYYTKSDVVAIKPTNKNAFKIEVSNFKGGHSGSTIHLRHISALKFVNDYLKLVGDVELISFETPGTTVYNVVPSACSAEFITNKTLDELIGLLSKNIDNYKNAGKLSENDKRNISNIYNIDEINKASYHVDPIDMPAGALSKEESSLIIKLHDTLLFGIKRWPTDEEMSKMIGDQTSGNIAPATLKLVNGKYRYSLGSYFRSNVKKDVDDSYDASVIAAKEAKTTFLCDAKYYGWQLDENASLREMIQKGWISAGIHADKTFFSRYHAGLEGSWWHYTMPEGSATVCYGPEIHDAHSCFETLFLDTVKQCVQTTVYVLQHANELK